MNEQRSAWEVICGEIEKIRSVLAGHPGLQEQVFPCLDEIKAAAESALPSALLPALSIKEYADSLPAPHELWAAAVAAGERFEFYGYTFWLGEGPSWSLTDPHGFDDVMILRDLDDFEDFLTLLRTGAAVG